MIVFLKWRTEIQFIGSFTDESFSADWAKLGFRHDFEKLRIFDFDLFLVKFKIL